MPKAEAQFRHGLAADEEAWEKQQPDPVAKRPGAQFRRVFGGTIPPYVESIKLLAEFYGDQRIYREAVTFLKRALAV